MTLDRNWMRTAFTGVCLTLAAVGAVAAKPITSVLDHKDWLGVCDNAVRCTVMAFAPDGDARAYLSIVRGAEPAAEATLKVVIYSDANIPSGPVHLHAPGFDADIPGRWDDDEITAQTRDPAQIAALARLIAGDARTLTVSIAKTSVPISLSGAAAALVWMDDRQERLGSTSALTRKGSRLATFTPPPLPVYTPAPKGSASEIKPVVFPKTLMAHPELKDCQKEELTKAEERGAWRLGPDLVLWAVPCTAGAYNLSTSFFLSDLHGGSIRVAPIPFIATPESSDPVADPPYNLINADFDPKTLILSAFEKARGVGDCGTLERYLWDGKAFQPLEFDYMPECRGVTPEAWPALYRGRAK